MPTLTTGLTLAAVLTLLPFLAFAFLPREIRRRCEHLPLVVLLCAPALLSIPYLLINLESHTFHVLWFLVYLLVPVAVACLSHHAATIDPDQNGAWPDFLVLLALGLAVDLRW